MVEVQHHHRSTLKQSNKPFKSKHATKSAIKAESKGRTVRQSPKSSASSKSAAQLRLNRKNTAKQAQLQKRQMLVSNTRIFNGVDGTPRIVAVVPLSDDVDARSVSSALAQSLDIDISSLPETGLWKIKAERFKTSLQFINLPYRQLYAALDACKVADYVVLALSTAVEVDDWGDLLLRSLQAQGFPTVVACAAPSHAVHNGSSSSSRAGILKSLLSFIQYFDPDNSKIFDLSTLSDGLGAVRALCEARPAEIRWRTNRPWMLADSAIWEEREAEGEPRLVNDEKAGVLCVTGVIRGAPLSANRLIHIPGHGDVQVEKIVSALLPKSSKHSNSAVTMDVESNVIGEPNADDADSMVSRNEQNDMGNEQTWPTEEEMNAAKLTIGESGVGIPDAKTWTTPKRIKRVPKGTSDYQAEWILDEDEDGNGLDDEGGSDDDDGMSMDDAEVEDNDSVQEDYDLSDNVIDSKEDKEEDEESGNEDVDEGSGMDIDTASKKDVTFDELDEEEEEKQLDAWRSRAREEEEDREFPDEILTPKDVPARTRFQRYRGLRSFRTSPWDPYENLPRDYGQIYEFSEFRQIDASVRRLTEEDETGIQPGTRVKIYLKGFSQLDAARCVTRIPFTLFGLLKYEHKLTVLNFTVQRNTEYSEPVRSKDPMILCVGPRRFCINPIYSQHTRGGGKGANNVHKFERWLRHGVTSVATTYGPITFGHQSCLLLKETSDAQAPQLVAMGSFLNPDPTRIIAKRIVLTGHPYKVHKKTATLRYMFFNPDDIAYFAPIHLHTKHGRTGHIKESLGTHGYFKAHFDGPINQMDTVCMSLYKRVYPRWPRLWVEKATDLETEDMEQ